MSRKKTIEYDGVSIPHRGKEEQQFVVRLHYIHKIWQSQAKNGKNCIFCLVGLADTLKNVSENGSQKN